MALADDIFALRDRALADLNAVLDYSSHTKIAWGIIRQSVLEGSKFAIKGTSIRLDPPIGDGSSPVLIERRTGTETTEATLADKARDYMNIQLPEATFQQFISIFEAFFGDFLRLWLLAHPAILSKKQIDFKTILEAPDKDAITQLMVDRELNDLTHGPPKAWFKYLDKTFEYLDTLKLGVPAKEEIQRFAEAKASRDVLVHNRGVANKMYESKAGTLARYRTGERIEIPGDYHKATEELIRKMVADISNAAIQKVS